MGFETPRLDDRSYRDLVEEARRRIPVYTPEWTDHNASDPGITLIELFAWLTDITLYRLNRVPDKHYVKFMELVGMKLREAEPARAPITLWLTMPQPADLEIEEGTEISTLRTETAPAIVFSTDVNATIYVPTLTHALTASASKGGSRDFRTYNVRRLLNGNESMPAFESRPPQAGDAFYLGFDEDLSYHILGVQLGVDAAEGAGIDPTNPPYVWEVMSPDAEQGWLPVEIDYDSTLGLNVNGLIRLHLPKLQKGTRNNITCYWVRCRLDPSRATRSYGVSPTLNRLLIESWGITIEATNVQRVKNEVIGRSDGTPGQKFYVAYTPIVPRIKSQEYLLVRMDQDREERWTEVADFASSTPEDRHYTLDSTTGEIRLGPTMPQPDGSMLSYGAIPPKGAMLVLRQYRYGGGQVGNLAPNTVNVLKTSIPYIGQVRNRVAAAGGLDGENLDTAKLRVPGYLRSLNRAVTAADFEYLALESSPGQIARVHCLQPPTTDRGQIHMLIIPRIANLVGYIAPESLTLPKDLRKQVYDYLDERRLLSTQLDVSAPVYQWVETEIYMRPKPYFGADEVRQAVEDKLYAFLNPILGGQEGTGWPFGRSLFVADIMAAINTVPGVEFVRAVRLFPVSYERGQFVRGDEVLQINLPPNGTISSYRHEVRLE